MFLFRKEISEDSLNFKDSILEKNPLTSNSSGNIQFLRAGKLRFYVLEMKSKINAVECFDNYKSDSKANII